MSTLPLHIPINSGIIYNTQLTNEEVNKLNVAFVAFADFSNRIFVCRESGNPAFPLVVCWHDFQNDFLIMTPLIVLRFLDEQETPKNTAIVVMMRCSSLSDARKRFIVAVKSRGYSNVMIRPLYNCFFHSLCEGEVFHVNGKPYKLPKIAGHRRILAMISLNHEYHCAWLRGSEDKVELFKLDVFPATLLIPMLNQCNKWMEDGTFDCVPFIADDPLLQLPVTDMFPKLDMIYFEYGFTHACLMGIRAMLSIQDMKYPNGEPALELQCWFNVRFMEKRTNILFTSLNKLPLDSSPIQLKKTTSSYVLVQHMDLDIPSWMTLDTLHLIGKPGKITYVKVVIDENHIVKYALVTELTEEQKKAFQVTSDSGDSVENSATMPLENSI